MALIDEITDCGPETLARFDAIIDVRSPSEFADDHIPGAINLPVLNDEERAEVGTIYKQESKFQARRTGAAYIARNVAGHLEGFFAGKPPHYRPLIYCWRGGMRSEALTTIIAQVGWRCGVVQGGYKTWRRAVVFGLRTSREPLNIILLDGQTGTAKTEILKALSIIDVQVIDLEFLAAHRGSVFGAMGGIKQPSQKMFESHIWRELQSCKPAKPIVIEAESNRIGRCEIPQRLWQSMHQAPRIIVTAGIRERSLFLTANYSDMIAYPGAITGAIQRLKGFHSNAQIEEWEHMQTAHEHCALAESLIREHYDPLYDRSRSRHGRTTLATLTLDKLDPQNITMTASTIAAIVKNFDLATLRDAVVNDAANVHAAHPLQEGS